MDLIKLLDISNPKKIKDTINLLISNYEGFDEEIRTIATEALNTAQASARSALNALAQVEENKTLVTSANQTSTEAKQIAEEALAIIESADKRSEEAAALAETAIGTAEGAVETSELAMGMATEAKSAVDQAISTGVFGTFVHNADAISLLHAYMTHNLAQEDSEDHFYIATPKLVRDALKAYYNKETIDRYLSENIENKVDSTISYSMESGLTVTQMILNEADGETAGVKLGMLSSDVTNTSGMYVLPNAIVLASVNEESNSNLSIMPDVFAINSSSIRLGGNVTIDGNITQNGESYETHAEQVYTKNDMIITRDEATGALGADEYTGIRAKLYDGTNDGLLVFGADGVARVGDDGDTQPLATREETPTNGACAYWDSTTKSFKTSLNVSPWNIAVGNSVKLGASAITSNYSVSIGNSASVMQAYGIAIGKSSSSGDVGALALGTNAQAPTVNAIAIGYNAESTGKPGSIALGFKANASAGASLVLGRNSAVSGDSSIVIGPSNTTTTANAVTIGSSITNNNSNSVVLGSGHVFSQEGYEDKDQGGLICIGTQNGAVRSDGGVLIGIACTAGLIDDTTGTINGPIAIGSSHVYGSYGVGIGYSCTALANGVSIGKSCSADPGSIAIGNKATANANGSIQLGKGTNSVANTLSVGLGSNNYTLLNADGTIPAERLVNAGNQEVTIDQPSTATNGTLTEDQLATLQANKSNYITFNGEKYNFADDHTTEGFLVYSHSGLDATYKFYVKCIAITLSTKGWVLKTLPLIAYDEETDTFTI